MDGWMDGCCIAISMDLILSVEAVHTAAIHALLLFTLHLVEYMHLQQRSGCYGKEKAARMVED